MTFDKSKVFTALNADEAKVGSKGYFANSISILKKQIEENANTEVLTKVLEESSPYRLRGNMLHALFYLVEEPQEEKYRPYETTDEMIEDYKERIKEAYGAYFSDCLMFSPIIWVKSKESDAECLIYSFIGDEIGLGSTRESLENVFEYYTYLDGTPCGKKI